MEPVFVLVHSPSVGPSTWQPVAAELTAAGYRVAVPSLLHVGAGGPPFWPRAVDAVRDAVRDALDNVRAAADQPVVLVAHSNAGLLVPVIRAGLDVPVAAAVLVDAALPARTGSSPAAPAELLGYLGTLAVDGVLPRWTDWWDEADVAPLFAGLADPGLRAAVIAEQPALPLAYFAQDIPVPPGWDNQLPCSYLLFSPAYDDTFADARERGWQLDRLPGAHLHQIVDPAGTAARLLALVRRTTR